MANLGDGNPQPPPSVDADPLAAELSSSGPDDLLKLLAHSSLNESQLLLLLERKDLSGAVLEEIGRHRDWFRGYRVRRALAFHPHIPRILAAGLLRDLYLVDLVKLSLAPVAVADLRHLAENLIVSRLGQVTLGEKITLAKRASPRVLAALIAEGVPRLFEPALRNPRLTEAQVLKLLANDRLHERVVVAIASHPRWESLPNIQLALLRHPRISVDLANKILPRVTVADLRTLLGVKTLPAKLREEIDGELRKRESPNKKKI
ncbi:MAG: hypothetical protein WAM91_11115 [Candidatus Acidiferrales bacterium]